MATSTPTENAQVAELAALARELYDKGEYHDAETACRRALTLSKTDPLLHRTLGQILHAQNRVNEAATIYHETVRLDPGDAEAFCNLALALGEQGRMPEAIAADREALKLCPKHVGALYHLAQLKRFSSDDPDLRALEALLEDSETMEERSLVFLYFALGKAYEDVGDYDRSFEFLHRANGLKRGAHEYDVGDDIRVMDETAAVFNREFLSGLGDVGSLSELPILIVGMPRSGTTLVEQILASHPKVHGGGELSHLPELAAAPTLMTEDGAKFPASTLNLDAEDFSRFGEGYVARLQALAPDATRVTDKLPWNFLFLGLIHVMLPRARIIHCRRDPLDTCLSCYKSNFMGVPFSFDLEDLGRYYRAYENLMEHWREVLPEGSVLEVEYEDLVTDLEPHARQIVSHCGLDWDDHCLEFHSTKRVVQTWSFAQVRRPVYSNAVGRWRRYQAYLDPLVETLRLDVNHTERTASMAE